MGGVVLHGSTLDFSTTATSMNFPFASGCEYLNFFNGASGNLTRNLIEGKPQGIVSGTPTANGQSANFNGSANYIQTGVAHTSNMTFFAVVMTPSAANDTMIISNYASPRTDSGTGTTTNGASLVLNSGTLARQIAVVRPTAGGADLNSQTSTASAGSLGVIRAVTGRFGTTTNSTDVYVNTSGTSGTIALAGTNTFSLGSPFRIGAGYSNVYVNSATTIYCAAIWSYEMSTTTILSVYNYFKAYYASLGTPIVI